MIFFRKKFHTNKVENFCIWRFGRILPYQIWANSEDMLRMTRCGQLSIVSGQIWPINEFISCWKCFELILNEKKISTFFIQKKILVKKLKFWNFLRFLHFCSKIGELVTFGFLNSFCELYAIRNSWLFFSQHLADEEFPRFFGEKVFGRWGHVAQCWASMVQNVFLSWFFTMFTGHAKWCMNECRSWNSINL